MTLHLKRFRYESRSGQPPNLAKINDSVEFDDELDIAEYCNGEGSTKYTLHSVLVHQGTPEGGHYYAYVRTNGRLPGLWVKCDDDVVSRVQKEEAVDANMGGDDSGLRQAPTEPLPQIPRTWSAYVLVYVRDDVYDTVIARDCSEEARERVTDAMRRQEREVQRWRDARRAEMQARAMGRMHDQDWRRIAFVFLVGFQDIFVREEDIPRAVLETGAGVLVWYGSDMFFRHDLFSGKSAFFFFPFFRLL